MARDVVIWGTGEIADTIMKRRVLLGDCNIISFIDNDSKKWGKLFFDIEINSPDIIKRLNLSAIIVCVNEKNYQEIKKQLTRDLKVDEDKIVWTNYKELENNLVYNVKQRYKNSEDVEINNILKQWDCTGFNIFGTIQLNMDKYDYIEFDNENWPYIYFEGKRMYFPKDYNFPTREGRKVVYNILAEQAKDSPHLYIKEDWKINTGSVIVDAGTCEGNFALRYVENAKKIYLIENDIKWIEALSRTFKPFKEKVVFCNKFLSRYDTEKSITLDTLVEENIDFLKMDIEGAEVDALLGGKNILTKSDAYCSICSYHRSGDEQYIKYLLESYGYNTSTSSGYMFFIFDPYMASSMDFRRGIVYGEK